MSSHQPATTPGALLLGLLLVPFAACTNPWLLAEMWPKFFRDFPDLWVPIFALHALWLGLAFDCIIRWRRLGKSRLAHRLFERQGWLGGLALTLTALLSTLAVAEVATWYLTKPRLFAQKWGTKETHTVDFQNDDPYLAVRSVPGAKSVHKCIKLPNREVIFEKPCSIGSDGLRVTPQPDVPKDYHLAMFGCSFMFGAGVSDEESFPAQIAGRVPGAHVYNFAYPAYGPGQTYLQLIENWTDVIHEKNGTAFFLLMKDHINRILPRIHHALTWTRKFPAFKLDDEGRAYYAGQMDTAYPWRLLFLDIASQEHFMKWSRADLPPAVPSYGYELCAAILAAARAEYQKRFPGNEFYVIIDPTCREDFRPMEILSALAKRGVPVINALGAFPEDSEYLYFPRDGHPTPEAHALLAKWFVAQFPAGLRAPPSPNPLNP